MLSNDYLITFLGRSTQSFFLCVTAPQFSHAPLRYLQSVQQSRCRSRFVFRHFNLQIEMQIFCSNEDECHSPLALVTNCNFEHLEIEIHIEMKLYNFPSVQQLRHIATLKHIQGVQSEQRLGFVDLDFECSTVCRLCLG